PNFHLYLQRNENSPPLENKYGEQSPPHLGTKPPVPLSESDFSSTHPSGRSTQSCRKKLHSHRVLSPVSSSFRQRVPNEELPPNPPSPSLQTNSDKEPSDPLRFEYWT